MMANQIIMIKTLAPQIDDSANAPSSICDASISIIKSLYAYRNFSIRYLCDAVLAGGGRRNWLGAPVPRM